MFFLNSYLWYHLLRNIITKWLTVSGCKILDNNVSTEVLALYKMYTVWQLVTSLSHKDITELYPIYIYNK